MADSRRASLTSRRGSRASHDLLEVIVRPKKYYTPSHIDTNSANRDKIVVDPNETRRIIKNLGILSAAMMLQYTAYQGTLNLQSSLNAKQGLGTMALASIYMSMGVSCLVLPTLVIRYLTAKWTLALSMSCFLPFIAFQLYSRFYTLLPSGILLGIASAPMWAAQATYITQIGQIYAILKGTGVDAVITLFFGIFFFFWQNADTLGNMVSSADFCQVTCGPLVNSELQGNYRTQERYEELAKMLEAEKGRVDEIAYLRNRAKMALEAIQDQGEKSDGEQDDLEDDVVVGKKTPKQK